MSPAMVVVTIQQRLKSHHVNPDALALMQVFDSMRSALVVYTVAEFNHPKKLYDETRLWLYL